MDSEKFRSLSFQVQQSSEIGREVPLRKPEDWALPKQREKRDGIQTMFQMSLASLLQQRLSGQPLEESSQERLLQGKTFGLVQQLKIAHWT